MKSLFLLISAFAAVPGWVSAQPGAADPAAQVPAVVYRSVFADTATGVEMESTDWKAANGAVGQFTNGHVDILKWEAAQEFLLAPKGCCGCRRWGRTETRRFLRQTAKRTSTPFF